MRARDRHAARELGLRNALHIPRGHGGITDRQVDTRVGDLDPITAELAHREGRPTDERADIL